MMNKLKTYFVKNKLKGDLQKCFRDAKIYKEVKGKNQMYKQYPKVRDIHIDLKDNVVRFVFTLPIGLNPEKVEKNKWVFVQMFSTDYTLHCQKNRKFILTVFANGFPPNNTFPFNVDEYKERAKKMCIPIITGKDEKGNMNIFDMLHNPHMLIMGETGSGKSVYLRSLITWLIIHLRERAEFVLADLKRSEFFLFRNIDNVRSVTNEPKEIMKELKRVDIEMTRRGDLFDAAEVANIEEYEEETGEKLPYIIVCIDEVALLKGDECMNWIERISCIGRSLGVMLILSLQRGDAKILDGQLKNNLTNRTVFRTADKVNSNIGLGSGTDADASTILKSHKGKFFFKSEGTTLLQAPWLEVKKAKELLAPFKNTPDLNKDVIVEQSDDFLSDFDLEGEDEE
jgi:DNA segregation ATPase FtsK/SpoIIIE, S-DNA-T family